MAVPDTKLAPFPPGNPFPQSLVDSTGNGADFPSNAGEREAGTKRPSRTPRLTVTAVSGDDGLPIGGEKLLTKFDELIFEIRTLRHAMVLQGFAADIDEPIK